MPVLGNDLYCPSCNTKQSQINFTNCEVCANDLGAPNVNELSTDNELNALKTRYNNAHQYHLSNGTKIALNNFETFFGQNAKAIINIDLSSLKEWLIIKGGAYKNYHRLVDEGIRKVSKPGDDRRRTMIDSYLYGSYGRDMVFAAISLNDTGLTSYGECSVILNDMSISDRATLLEENSYNFVKTHNVNFETLDIPLGYRSKWDNKIKLGTAKLYQKITTSNTAEDYCKLVLYTEGDRDKRQNDEFIELHIYKGLSPLTVKSIQAPTPKDRTNSLYLNIIKRKYPGKITEVS